MYQISSNHRKKIKLTPVLTLLWLVILAGLLVACSEAPINSQPTATINNTTNPTQKKPNNPAATTKPIGNPPVSTATSTKVATTASKPVITFLGSESAVVEIGHSLSVSGWDFPAQTQLVLMIGHDESQMTETYATPVTDGQGRFSANLSFEAGLVDLNPGTYLLKVFVANDPNTGASSLINVAASVHNAPTTVTPVPVGQSPATLNSPNERAVVGQQIRLDGAGYTANTTAHIKGGMPNQLPDYTGTIQIDAQGRFTLTVIMPDDLANYTGPYHFATDDPGDKAGLTLSIVTKSNYEPELVTGAAQEIQEGQPLTLGGHNFPPNTEVKLRGGVQNPGDDFGSVTTDANGSFTKVITISGLHGYKGVYHIIADWNSLTDAQAMIMIK